MNKMKRNKISIIIPVYNVESYVGDCINSIKSQTFTDFEAIIVDDGSMDSSIEICKNLTNGDSRFIILHKENGGLMSAWKYGLIHASGDYIGFVDSDDWIDSTMYEILYDTVAKYDADIVVSGYVTEGETKHKRWTRDRLFIYEDNDVKNSFVKEYCCSYFNSISNPSINRWDKLYRKEILMQNLDLFNENISLAEDFNANIPVILDSKRIVLLPNFTPYHYRFNPKSIVNSINPKAFNNIYELGIAWLKISRAKKFESVYVESFIGNIIFEELNRICRCVPYSLIDKKDLNHKLEQCNGYHYLDCYAKVRLCKRIYLYNWCIQHNLFSIVKTLNYLNDFRRHFILI